MRRLLMGLVTAVALAGVVTLPAQAQKKDKDDKLTRSVQGVVSDSKDNPLDGAVVQLKDTKTLQIRSFITKQNGTYHFHSLNPDIDYELKAEHQGANSGSKTLSSFDSRKSAVINLKIDK
jgi:carboxypeptidase family protein